MSCQAITKEFKACRGYVTACKGLCHQHLQMADPQYFYSFLTANITPYCSDKQVLNIISCIQRLHAKSGSAILELIRTDISTPMRNFSRAKLVYSLFVRAGIAEPLSIPLIWHSIIRDCLLVIQYDADKSLEAITKHIHSFRFLFENQTLASSLVSIWTHTWVRDGLPTFTPAVWANITEAIISCMPRHEVITLPIEGLDVGPTTQVQRVLWASTWPNAKEVIMDRVVSVQLRAKAVHDWNFGGLKGDIMAAAWEPARVRQWCLDTEDRTEVSKNFW